MLRFFSHSVLVALALFALGLNAQASSAQTNTLDVSGTTLGAPTAALPLFGSTPGACVLAPDAEPYEPTPFLIDTDGAYAVSVVEPISVIPATDDTILLVYEGEFDPGSACDGFVGVGNETAGSGLTVALSAASDYVLVVAGFFGSQDDYTVRITGPEGSIIINPEDVAPGFSKAFDPATIYTGHTSTLRFTIDNSVGMMAATDLAFTDDFPGGVLIASPANASTTCTGGTLTATEGASTVSYSGGTVAAGATCTVQVDVSAGTEGTYDNTSSALTSSAGDSGTATATLTVQVRPNQPPVADAGEDRTVIAGQQVTLDGSGSSDPDGGELTYAWTLSGPGYSDTALGSAMPTFCAASVGSYAVSLIVNDGSDDSAPDEVTVTAIALSADTAIINLIADVNALRTAGVLNTGQTNALTRKLNQAKQLLGRGKTADAVTLLNAFRQQVLDLKATGVLASVPDDADALVASVDVVLGVLSSPCSVSAPPASASGPIAAVTESAQVAEAPTEFALQAPYPNPALSALRVPYSLPEAVHVRLSVYDLLGREVAVLVHGPVEAGRYAVPFDGERLPAGTYVVRLEAGAFAAAAPLTILR